MDRQTKHLLGFGSFRIDVEERLLLRDHETIPLSPKAFEMLLVLVRHSERVVLKDDLMKTVWPDTFVEESNLSQHIFQLRKALGESAQDPQYIVTVPGRGYRFAQKVQELSERGNGLEAQSHSSEQIIGEEETDSDRSGAAGVRRWVAQGEAAPRRHRRWQLAAGAVLLSGLASVAWFNLSGWGHRLLHPGATPPIRSLAVLPFENLSGDHEQDYFVEGMTDDVITDLAKLGGLDVISRTSVMVYRGSPKTLPQIARELKVSAIVEGTVRRQGNRVRVTVQLIQGDTDRHLWADSYEREVGDVLSLQSDLAAAIARKIQLTLSPQAQAQLASHAQLNPEAYDAYLRGRYFWNKRTLENFDRAIQYFKHAIERDPSYAAPYAGLADTYLLLGEQNWRPREETFPLVRAAAEQALKLDGALAEAHASLGALDRWEGNYTAAEREFRLALQSNPGYATAHQWYAEFLDSRGRLDEAVAEIKRAKELDPLSLIVNAQLGWILYLAGHNDEAIEQLRRAVDIDPNFWESHSDLGFAYEQKGMYAQAISEFQKSVDAPGGPPEQLAWLAHAYALSGQKEAALRILAPLGKPSARGPVPTESMAIAYYALGEKAVALRWLKQACAEPSAGFPAIFPPLRPLLSDPPFDAVLRGVASTRSQGDCAQRTSPPQAVQATP